ncbi:MAG TPA: Hsp20/alpha crystallin family protein [Bacteroidia bacterium]|jgi:HSP20 family protein|nr:Hsp20/alpha crystallin family protein [Bacteroidia bacterium]
MNGQTSTSVTHSPISDLLENFFGDSLYPNEYSNFVPAVNLSEDENQYMVELSAPGFNKENFKLEVHKGVLSISGNHEEEKETKEKNYSRKEYNRGSFVRKFTLPESAKEDAIDAKYENGILKVSIPKQEEAKRAPKEIRIS